MNRWQDEFATKLRQVKTDIDAAQLYYENGTVPKEQIEDHLKSARILLKEASGILVVDADLRKYAEDGRHWRSAKGVKP